MKRKIVRALVSTLVLAGTAWWFWSAGPRPWRVVDWGEGPHQVQFTPDGRTLIAGERGVTVVDVGRDAPPAPGRSLPGSEAAKSLDDPPGIDDLPRTQLWLPRWHPRRKIVRVSPDGSLILAASHSREPRSTTGSVQIRLWDRASETLRQTWTLSYTEPSPPLQPGQPVPKEAWLDKVLDFGFADRGRLVRVVRAANPPGICVQTWDAATGRPQPDRMIVPQDLDQALLVADGSALLLGDVEGSTLTLHDLATDQMRAQASKGRWHHPFPVFWASASPDGSLVATSSLLGDVDVWTTQGERPTAQKLIDSEDKRTHTSAIEVASHGPTVAIRSGSSIQVWDIRRRAFTATIPTTNPDNPTTAMALSPDGRTLARAVRTFHTPTTWERTAETVWPYLYRVGIVKAWNRQVPDLSPSRIQLYDAATGRLLARWLSAPHNVEQLRFSPDGRTLAVHGWFVTVEGTTWHERYQTALWDVPELREATRSRINP